MRCHITQNDVDETNPPAYNIWTSGNLPTPHILKSILYPDDSDLSTADELNKLDSTSQKRKLLECELEDIEERFHKIRRKKHLQKAAARANLVVDDGDNDSDEEDRLYQQMDWIEKQSALTLAPHDTNSDDSLFDEKHKMSVLYMSRSKWKEERCQLLRISMAKIYNVEDPEAYLRRSVLINNTVRRLHNDIPINLQSHSLSTSFTQGSVSYQNNGMHSWNGSVVCNQEADSDTFTFSYQYEALENSHVNDLNCSSDYTGMPCSLNLHLACASFSTDKRTLETLQCKVLQNGSAFYDRNALEDQTVNDESLSLILKQPSTLCTFSPQPCGLQYNNPIHVEKDQSEYGESSSSIIDSVVYHSLIASLET